MSEKNKSNKPKTTHPSCRLTETARLLRNVRNVFSRRSNTRVNMEIELSREYYSDRLPSKSTINFLRNSKRAQIVSTNECFESMMYSWSQIGFVHISTKSDLSQLTSIELNLWDLFWEHETKKNLERKRENKAVRNSNRNQHRAIEILFALVYNYCSASKSI